MSVDPDFNQTLDAYGYADENPLDSTDLSGLAAQPKVKTTPKKKTTEAPPTTGPPVAVPVALQTPSATASYTIPGYGTVTIDASATVHTGKDSKLAVTPDGQVTLSVGGASANISASGAVNGLSYAPIENGPSLSADGLSQDFSRSVSVGGVTATVDVNVSFTPNEKGPDDATYEDIAGVGAIVVVGAVVVAFFPAETVGTCIAGLAPGAAYAYSTVTNALGAVTKALGAVGL